MFHFTVDPEQAGSGCNTCCCEKMAMQPGTTSKVTINYVPWAMPMQSWLNCTTSFAVELLETCVVPVAGSNLPPIIYSPDQMARFNTGMNVALNADMKSKVADPEGVALVFKVLPHHGPKHGKIELQTNGLFVYTPHYFYKGEERFYCTASDGVTDPLIFEVLIAIEIDAGLMVPTPKISIGPAIVNDKMYSVSFPVTMSPAAQPCDMWRLTVLQGALDCACICYTRTDCYDIGVAKC
jgi:hypothetical protein